MISRFIAEKLYWHIATNLSMIRQLSIHLALLVIVLPILSACASSTLNTSRNLDISPPLHQSADQGNTDTIDRLLDNGADINARDADGWSPLHVAASKDHTDVIDRLLHNDAYVQARNTNGRPLHVAASQDCVNAINKLLGNDADVHARDERGRTPLHWAARQGRVNAIDRLLDNDTDVNARDADDCPLHLAARKGHVATINLLLDKSADPWALTNFPWFSPLDHLDKSLVDTQVYQQLRDGSSN